MFIDPTGKTLADAIYGSLETIDDNLFSGAATFISEWLTEQKYDYNPKNQQHYYIGRVVGDVFSILAGAGIIKSGSSMIMAGLGAEGGLALMTDGTSLVLLDGAVAVSLTTAGTVAITYGGKTIVSSAEGLYDDVNSLIKLSNKERLIGENGTKFDSKTVWKNGKTERLDVENPAPGKRNGQIHYHDSKNKTWMYDIENGYFYDNETNKKAPNSIQNLLKDDNFKKGITKALKYLGE